MNLSWEPTPRWGTASRIGLIQLKPSKRQWRPLSLSRLGPCRVRQRILAQPCSSSLTVLVFVKQYYKRKGWSLDTRSVTAQGRMLLVVWCCLFMGQRRKGSFIWLWAMSYEHALCMLARFPLDPDSRFRAENQRFESTGGLPRVHRNIPIKHRPVDGALPSIYVGPCTIVNPTAGCWRVDVPAEKAEPNSSTRWSRRPL